MQTTKKFTVAGLCVALLPAVAFMSSGVSAMTLQEAVQKTVEKNPDVQFRLRNFQAATSEVGVTRGGLRPRVDLQAVAGREKRDIAGTNSSYSNPSVGLSLRQLLFDGNATLNETRRFDRISLARFYEFLSAADDAALEATRAYIDVRRYQKLTLLARDNWAIHQEILDQVQDRVKAGVGRRVDLEQINGRTALAKSNWLTETSNLHDVGARFRRLVGEAPEGIDSTPEIKSKLPVETDLLNQAVRNNPAFVGAVAGIEASRADVAARKGAYSPNIALELDHTRGKNLNGVRGSYDTSTAQVVLNYNIYRGGSDDARVAQGKELMYGSIELRDKACRDVRQTTAIAYNDMRRLTEQLQYLEQHMLSTEKARDAYRQQFDIGQRTLLDVLDTENELFEAKRAYARAEYDLLLARYRVLAQLGQIMDEVGVKRPKLISDQQINELTSSDYFVVNCPVDMAALEAMDTKAALAARPVRVKAEIPQTATAGAAPVSTEDSPEATVRSWAKAWSDKNLDRYYGFYSDNFTPEKRSMDDWRAFRKRMLGKNGPINVEVQAMKIEKTSATQAQARFIQRYTSLDYTDVVFKTLYLEQKGKEWKIMREVSDRMK